MRLPDQSPYLARWRRPETWSPTGLLIGLLFYIGLGVGATLLLPAGFGPALMCGVLFFLFSLIKIEFGIYIVVASMLLSPEINVGETAQRTVTIRIEDLLILALVVAWVLKTIIEGRQQLFRRTPINRPIYCYLFLALFSTLWGITFGKVEPQTSVFYYLKTVEFFLIFFITVSSIREESEIRRFIIFFLLMGVIIGAYGVLQIGHVRRISAPFEGDRPEPNTLGGYLTVVLSLALALLIYSPREYIHYRVMSLVVISLCFLTLLFTLSRASFLGFLFMLILMGLLSKRYVLLYAVAVLLVVAPLVLPQEVIERVNYTFSGPPGNDISIFGFFSINVDSSTLERISVWKKVGHSFLQSPLWGHGLTAQYILDSQFGRLLVEVGAIGTGLFIWILVRLFRCAWYLLRRSQSWFSQAIGLSYIAALSGMIVHSMGTITFYIVRIMEPFWFFTGLMVFLYVQQREKDQSVEPQQPKPVEPRWIYPTPSRRRT